MPCIRSFEAKIKAELKANSSVSLPHLESLNLCSFLMKSVSLITCELKDETRKRIFLWGGVVCRAEGKKKEWDGEVSTTAATVGKNIDL